MEENKVLPGLFYGAIFIIMECFLQRRFEHLCGPFVSLCIILF